MRLPEFIRLTGQTFEELAKFPYLAEAFLWKINYSYRRMFLEEHEDQAFRRMLAKVFAARSGVRGRKLDENEAKAFQNLERSRLIEVLRRQKEV